MAVAMGPLSLTGQKEPGHEQLYAFRVGVAGPNDDLSRFYPYIYKNTGDETKIEWKANSWYRVDATADLDAKTFRCAFYDLGTATPKFETVGTLAYETGDLPFRGEGDTREQVDSIGALEIVVYRGGIGDDWNTRVACDNIRVWKQPAGASSWTEMFSTDFATTKRFNEKMAESSSWPMCPTIGLNTAISGSVGS